MFRSFKWHLITAVLLGSPIPALAQVQIQPGSRVRIEAPTVWQERQVGTVSAVHGDTLFVAVEGIGGDDRALTLDSIDRLELSTGRHGNAGVGALVGFGSGALFGLLATAQAETAPCGFSTCTAGEQRVLAVTVLGVLFGGLGALIGAISKTDDWTDMSASRIRIGLVQPRRGRLGFGAAVPF